MNEITQIHLGRTAFTIAVDAHGELRTYLAAIKKRAGSEVQEEIELRMAELLLEQNITADKVILLSDVEYLKKQLGDPKDFADDETEAGDDQEDNIASQDLPQRKLYRDVRSGWLGGVASGLANYIGVSATLVRIAFILLTFAWGASIIVYLLLWLLLPDAKSPSDMLRMQGKPVNVDTIKEFVKNQAGSEDMRATGRAVMNGTWHETPQGTRVGSALTKIVRVGLAVVGVGIMLGALTGILATIGFGTYWLTNPAEIFNGVTLFPIGSSETWLAVGGIAVVVLMGILLAMSGLSLVREKWPTPGWVTGSLVGVILVGLAVIIPVSASMVPKIQERHEKAYVTSSRAVDGTFTNLFVEGEYANVFFETSDRYEVAIKTYGKQNTSKIETSIANDVLTIRAHEPLKDNCNVICDELQIVQIIVRAPELKRLDIRDGASFTSGKRLQQTALTISAEPATSVYMNYINAETAIISKDDEFYVITLSGIAASSREDSTLNFYDTYTINGIRTIDYVQDAACDTNMPLLLTASTVDVITINKQVFAKKALSDEQDQTDGTPAPINCVAVFYE